METNVVQRDELEIEIVGKVIKWPRPVRQAARRQLVDVARIEAKANGDQASRIEGTADIVDFLCKWHPHCERMRAQIESDATDMELVRAWAAIGEFLGAPFENTQSGSPPTNGASSNG